MADGAEEWIASARLTLEPLRVEHAEEMIAVLADDSLYTFTGGKAPTLASLEARYRTQIAGSRRPGEVWRNWIIRTIADRKAIGFGQADIADGIAELAWVIGVASQGNGYATEAAIAMRDRLVSEGSTRFQAFIHPEHAVSHAVARSVGMSQTGEIDDDGEEQWLTSLD